MEKVTCVCCQKPKAGLICGICQSSICKSCAQFLPEDSFSFLPQIPDALTKGTYCSDCFINHIADELQSYEQAVQDAKEIQIFMKNQGKETRLIKRDADPIQVTNCPDREETILRLAFLAVRTNFNAVIDVDLVGEKVRAGAYQTTTWKATGMPAHVRDSELVKDRSIWHNPS